MKDGATYHRTTRDDRGRILFCQFSGPTHPSQKTLLHTITRAWITLKMFAVFFEGTLGLEACVDPELSKDELNVSLAARSGQLWRR